MAAEDVTTSDVENLSSDGWTHLDAAKKTEGLNMAQNLITGPLTERVATLPTLQGDEEDATKLLAAHLWELWEGGEAESESGGGGSVSYNTVTGEVVSSLMQTRYGRTLHDIHLRDEQGVGIVRTR